MTFTSTTASIAGKISKRGKGKISTTMRQFLFELLNENKEKFTYMLGELSPRDLINVYMKLVPYIIAMRHLQQFDVSEISRKETEELVKDN